MPDNNLLDREEAIRKNIIHDENHDRNHRRLQGLYGRVARRQNALIAQHCIGQRILDVGAGYGNLTRQLIDLGKDAIGLEIDEVKIDRAKEWFGVDLHFADFYSWESDGAPVDTVIFREAVNHLDLAKAFARVLSIGAKRCIVFQGTENLALRVAKRFYGHEEFDQKTPAIIVSGLKQAGFDVQKVLYSDVLAFPLSGGYIGRSWVPRNRLLEKTVMATEAVASRSAALLGLSRQLGFRVLIAADRADATA